jgi:uncharacterized repeat protein (TIGR01451 family)
MDKKKMARCLGFLMLLLLLNGNAACGTTLAVDAPLTAFLGTDAALRRSAIQTPVLKWAYGGCYSSWCETGWYSSPAVADLDGDGHMEVIASAYSIVVLDGDTGSAKWRVKSGHDRSEGLDGVDNVGRTWPGIAVADVDADGQPEIIAAHGGGYVSVYDQNGYFEPGWPRRPVDRELRGLAVYDLDDDGTSEIVVTAAVGDKINTWVYQHQGTLRPGWPQLSNSSGYAYGVFNDNAAVSDLDGDGIGEIVVPSDVHYICAYEADGLQIPAHSMYGGVGWGRVGVWESLDTELRGWGTCQPGDDRSERYRANFAHGPAVIADVDGNGINELVAVGNVYDCIPGYPSQYNGLYIFNADRSRFSQGGYDWRYPPTDTGAPLSEDYGEIENNQPNPVVADLDGDGKKEILYSSYDGRVHAFWLDRSEHGDWPYDVYGGSGVYRFASEPVVVDLDHNGYAEVILTSWVQKESYQTGDLIVLNHLGELLHKISLPAAYGSPDWNGGLAAPTLADLDSDDDLEIVLNTAHSGVVVFDLPGTAFARVLWGTGRGNQQRTGSLLTGSLDSSTKSAYPTVVGSGELVTYTIVLRNPGPALAGVRVTDSLPSGLEYSGPVMATAGQWGEAGGTITWTGNVLPAVPVTISFDVRVAEQLVTPTIVLNTARIDAGLGTVHERQALLFVEGHVAWLPLIEKR